MFDLMGRTILITGASSGIGEAMARLFAREGGRLLLCARRTDRLEELAAELRAAHECDIHVFHLDVGDRDQVSMAFRGLPDSWSSIDVLVNNAGLSRGMDPVQEGSLDDWDEMIRTNVSGLLYVTRQVLPGMVRRGRGDILNIVSTAGHEAYPGGAVYCATKHAVDAFTQGLRKDLVSTPLRVMAVSPGMTETEFSLVRFHGDREQADRVYNGMTPLAARDVAEAALFALTRPAHVQVGEIILWPTNQAGSTLVARDSSKPPHSSTLPPPHSVPPNESAWRGFYELNEEESGFPGSEPGTSPPIV
ncbi:MAG: SDR family oxidoreductase [Fibrobacteria bacterium]|nr:SDR family oxidoreductase [Fibrobacteria bacterium]